MKLFTVRPAYNRFSGGLANRREANRLHKAADRAAYSLGRNLCSPANREQAERNLQTLQENVATSQFDWEIVETFYL